MSKPRKISTMSGYRFLFTGMGDPMRAKDDDWEIVAGGAEQAHLVGIRKIDGSNCYVMRVGKSKGRHHYVAQTVVSLQ